MDANWRVVILEGLVGGGMGALLARLGRDFANSTIVKYLANQDVQFTNRMYAKFNLAPKDIKLRDPLTTIMKQPGLYNRLKVPLQSHPSYSLVLTQLCYIMLTLRVRARVFVSVHVCAYVCRYHNSASTAFTE